MPSSNSHPDEQTRTTSVLSTPRCTAHYRIERQQPPQSGLTWHIDRKHLASYAEIATKFLSSFAQTSFQTEMPSNEKKSEKYTRELYICIGYVCKHCVIVFTWKLSRVLFAVCCPEWMQSATSNSTREPVATSVTPHKNVRVYKEETTKGFRLDISK